MEGTLRVRDEAGVTLQPTGKAKTLTKDDWGTALCACYPAKKTWEIGKHKRLTAQ